MARNATFTVSLDKAANGIVTVDYATVAVSAVAGTDFTHTAGTLTFAAGQTTKTVAVPVADDADVDATFRLSLSNPAGCTISNAGGLCTIGAPGVVQEYHSRFNAVYAALHNTANGYFGPQTGANSFVVPRHIPEADSRIINEAPDYGGETVSETASFWVALEAMNGDLNGDWTGYNTCWNRIEQFYIPSGDNQPECAYNADSPADYIPEGRLPSDYPRLAPAGGVKGVDPLADELAETYGTPRVYLMHWIIDVEGAYGFHNGDGATKVTFINTYERGLQESSFETVTHPCWGDWNNGGSVFGYEPLFTQGKQWYPAAQYDWGKKWSYTNAPDAEARAIQWALWASVAAAAQGKATTIGASQSKAKKMGDYLRYNLFDKYFRQIGNNQAGATFANDGSYKSCHYLINWYAAFGGEIPATAGAEGTWSYRIGCSECHQGYQAPDTAWAMATGGGGMTPLSPSAGDVWLGSVYRQIEMVRWLQSPEGPIAGGVTNSMFAAYETVSDGRQNARFYGMDYVYSPVWHDPPSNNWVGFQAWGQGRTAHLFYQVSQKTDAFNVEVRKNTEIILDRLVAWFLDESELTEDGSFSLPSNLSWVSPTPIAGQTTTTANLEGVYEYLPSMNWPGSGTPDYATFWSQSGVPNPNLHCTVSTRGTDLGVAASLALLLLYYAQAKRNMGKFDTAIPNSSWKPSDAFALAKALIDRTWTLYWDGIGISIPEPRGDYNRLADAVYIPPNFTGTMPNGDPITPGNTTCISIRSFLQDDPMWPACEAYLNGTGPEPVFTYHRFWANAEYAAACGVLHKLFGDLVYA